MPTASPAPEGFLPGGSSKGFVVSALTGSVMDRPTGIVSVLSEKRYWWD